MFPSFSLPCTCVHPNHKEIKFTSLDQAEENEEALLLRCDMAEGRQWAG